MTEEHITTKIWAGSGNNIIIKIPDEIFEKGHLKLERTLVIVPKGKGNGIEIKNIKV